MTNDIHARIPDLIGKLRHDHIELPRDLALKAELNRLIEQMWVKKFPDLPPGVGNRDEQDAIVVSGPTGTGKTHTIRQVLGSISHLLVSPAGEALKIISVKCPSPFSGKELARRILREMQVQMSDRLNEIELWEAVCAHFEANKVAVLHLDEFQRYATVKALGRAQRIEAADRLAATLNEILMHDRWPVSLMISGTEAMLPFWRTSNVDQVYRRTKFCLFNPMDNSYYGFLEDAVKRYAGKASLTLSIGVNDLGGRLCMAAENTAGIALELAQEAVVSAVRAEASALTIRHFAEVFARRTGVARDQNPFLSANWTKIGVRQKLNVEEVEEDERDARDLERKRAKVKAGA